MSTLSVCAALALYTVCPLAPTSATCIFVFCKHCCEWLCKLKALFPLQTTDIPAHLRVQCAWAYLHYITHGDGCQGDLLRFLKRALSVQLMCSWWELVSWSTFSSLSPSTSPAPQCSPQVADRHHTTTKLAEHETLQPCKNLFRLCSVSPDCVCVSLCVFHVALYCCIEDCCNNGACWVDKNLDAVLWLTALHAKIEDRKLARLFRAVAKYSWV